MFLKKKHLKNSALLSATFFIMVACETTTVYHSYRHICEKGWGKNDTLLFTFPITGSVPNYLITIEVRNDEKYPYRDLYLFVERKNTLDSTICITDTIKCILADEQGQWKGKGLALSYQSVHFYTTMPYSRTTEQTLKISHGMKDNFLKGIRDVGIHIEKQ